VVRLRGHRLSVAVAEDDAAPLCREPSRFEPFDSVLSPAGTSGPRGAAGEAGSGPAPAPVREDVVATKIAPRHQHRVDPDVPIQEARRRGWGSSPGPGRSSTSAPGTPKIHRLQENTAAIDVEFTSQNLKELTEAADRVAVRGDGERLLRYIPAARTPPIRCPSYASRDR
jgi:hypothetical protein